MSEDLQERLCDILVAWDAYEKSRPDGQPVIDSNYIAHRTNRTFTDRRQIRDAWLDIYDSCEAGGDDNARERVGCFVTYLDACENVGRFSLLEYFSRMTGVELRVVPAETFAEIETRFHHALAALNIDFADAENALLGAEPALDATEFESFVRTQIDADLPVFTERTGLQDVKLSYEVHVENSQELWRGWIRGDENLHFTLKFNQAVLGRLTRGSLVATVRHELLGHGVLDTLRTGYVRAGKLPKSVGIFTTAAYDLVQSEAIAEGVPLLFEPKDEIEAAWRCFHDYRRAVGTNTYMLHATQGREAALAYYKEKSPFFAGGDYGERLLDGIEKSPLWRFYTPLYGPVRQVFADALQDFGRDRFGTFLGEIYPKWLTAKGVNQVLQKNVGRGCGFSVAQPRPPARG